MVVSLKAILPTHGMLVLRTQAGCMVVLKRDER